MAHGLVVLRAGHQSAAGVHALVLSFRLEARAVGEVRPFRSFQEKDVIERRGVERRERHDDARRVVAGRHREVRTPPVRRSADGAHPIGDQREVHHLLACDVDDDGAKARRRRRFLARQPAARPNP
jgi:hypothetical protein